MKRKQYKDMTVNQLINKLTRFPPDMNVKIYAEYDGGFAWAGDDVDELNVRKDNRYNKKVVAIISYEKPL